MQKHQLAAASETKPAHYLDTYYEYLWERRDEPFSLFELGILKGESLRYWRSVFPNATIVGLDRDPVDMADVAVRTYEGLQQDKALLDRIAAENAPDGFDVIIDDASHIGHYTRQTFWHLMDNHLKPGGLYFVEDWGTGYWPRYPDGAAPGPHRRVGPTMAERLSSVVNGVPALQHASLVRRIFRKLASLSIPRRFPSHDYGMVGFVKELVDECAVPDITHPLSGARVQRTSRIEWLRIGIGLVVVKRAGGQD